MWIDTHVHLWELAKQHPIPIRDKIAGLARDFLISDLRPLAGACDVGGVVLVSASESMSETRYMLGLRDRYPDFIKAVCGWVDLTEPRAIDQLEEIAARPGFAGVREMPAFNDGAIFRDEEFIASAHRLATMKLSLDLLCRPDQLDAVDAFAVRVPELQINVNHCGRPSPVCREWDGWAQSIAALARLPNVTVKVSGLIERGGFEWRASDLKPYLLHLFDTFGCSRLMFASNWPVLNLTGTYRRWWDALQSTVDSANLSPSERQDLFRGSAERFYRF